MEAFKIFAAFGTKVGLLLGGPVALRSAPGAHLGGFPFESQGAFPA